MMRAIAEPNPQELLHVTRPEVDLAPGVDPHGPAAHAKARENLDAFLAQGWMVQDEAPCFYLYSQTWRDRTQTGLMAACSVAEYDAGQIKRHELPRVPTRSRTGSTTCLHWTPSRGPCSWHTAINRRRSGTTSPPVPRRPGP